MRQTGFCTCRVNTWRPLQRCFNSNLQQATTPSPPPPHKDDKDKKSFKEVLWKTGRRTHTHTPTIRTTRNWKKTSTRFPTCWRLEDWQQRRVLDTWFCSKTMMVPWCCLHWQGLQIWWVSETGGWQQVADICVCTPTKLDGHIARKYNMKTLLGTIIDPLADKVLMTVMTVTLAMEGTLPGLCQAVGIRQNGLLIHYWAWAVPLAAVILGRDAGLVLSAFYYRYISLPEPVCMSWHDVLRPAKCQMYRKPLHAILMAQYLPQKSSQLKSARSILRCSCF